MMAMIELQSQEMFYSSWARPADAYNYDDLLLTAHPHPLCMYNTQHTHTQPI